MFIIRSYGHNQDERREAGVYASVDGARSAAARMSEYDMQRYYRVYGRFSGVAVLGGTYMHGTPTDPIAARGMLRDFVSDNPEYA